MAYNIEIDILDFLTLTDKNIKDCDHFTLNILLSALKKNPSLIKEILDFKAIPNPYQPSTSYVDVLLSAKRFDWAQVLIEHDNFQEQLLPIIKTKIKRIKEYKQVMFISNIENLLKNPFDTKIKEELKPDNDYVENLQLMFKSFSEQILNLAATNKKEIEDFLNLQIQRPLKSQSDTKPLFFTFLPMFEHVVEHLKNIDIINWQACDSNGNNILFNLLDYSMPVIQLIIEKTNKEDWAIKNNNDKNAVLCLAETDLTQYKKVNRLQYVLEKNLLDFDGYNNEFRVLLKRTIKSYNLSSNSEALKEKIMEIFLTLNDNPLINSLEGQNALELIHGSKVDSKKIQPFLNALLYKKLEENLPMKTQHKKLKI